jgi:hypothetical protein
MLQADAEEEIPSGIDVLAPYVGEWVSEDGSARQVLVWQDRYRSAVLADLYFKDGVGWSHASAGRYLEFVGELPLDIRTPEYQFTGDFSVEPGVEMGFVALGVSPISPSELASFDIGPVADPAHGLWFENRAQVDRAVWETTLEHWTPPQDGRFTYTLYQSTETGGWTEWFSGTWIRIEEDAE